MNNLAGKEHMDDGLFLFFTVVTVATRDYTPSVELNVCNQSSLKEPVLEAPKFWNICGLIYSSMEVGKFQICLYKGLVLTLVSI